MHTTFWFAATLGLSIVLGSSMRVAAYNNGVARTPPMVREPSRIYIYCLFPFPLIAVASHHPSGTSITTLLHHVVPSALLCRAYLTRFFIAGMELVVHRRVLQLGWKGHLQRGEGM